MSEAYRIAANSKTEHKAICSESPVFRMTQEIDLEDISYLLFRIYYFPSLLLIYCIFLVCTSQSDSSVSPANKQAASPVKKWFLLLLGQPLLGHRGEQHLPAASVAVLPEGFKTIIFDQHVLCDHPPSLVPQKERQGSASSQEKFVEIDRLPAVIKTMRKPPALTPHTPYILHIRHPTSYLIVCESLTISTICIRSLTVLPYIKPYIKWETSSKKAL